MVRRGPYCDPFRKATTLGFLEANMFEQAFAQFFTDCAVNLMMQTGLSMEAKPLFMDLCMSRLFGGEPISVGAEHWSKRVNWSLVDAAIEQFRLRYR